MDGDIVSPQGETLRLVSEGQDSDCKSGAGGEEGSKAAAAWKVKVCSAFSLRHIMVISSSLRASDS